MNKKTEIKQKRINEMIRLESLGNTLNEIALILKISKSSLYKYKEELAIKGVDNILERIYNSFKTNYSIAKCIGSSTFSEISAIARKFRLYGITKKEKIKSITEYLENYVMMGIKPKTTLTKSMLKTQYFKRAKEVHPDINKNLNGSEFISLHRAYEHLNSITYC